MNVTEANEGVRRVHAALAEMGYGHVHVEAKAAPEGWLKDWAITWPMPAVPDAIAWMAAKVAGVPIGCWSCWNKTLDGEVSEKDYVRCTEGECLHPDHPYPPRELLVPRQVAS
jgi:hypothetical protein